MSPENKPLIDVDDDESASSESTTPYIEWQVSDGEIGPANLHPLVSALWPEAEARSASFRAPAVTEDTEVTVRCTIGGLQLGGGISEVKILGDGHDTEEVR